NAARFSSMSMSVGLGSGNRSARMAAAKMTMIQAIAAQNSSPSRRDRFRVGAATILSRMPSSSVAMADPRVENGVQHVDDDEADGDQQHGALQDDEIAGVDRADDQPADARQRKNRLDNDGATDQPPDIDPGHRDQRQRRRF